MKITMIQSKRISGIISKSHHHYITLKYFTNDGTNNGAKGVLIKPLLDDLYQSEASSSVIRSSLSYVHRTLRERQFYPPIVDIRERLFNRTIVDIMVQERLFNPTIVDKTKASLEKLPRFYFTSSSQSKIYYQPYTDYLMRFYYRFSPGPLGFNLTDLQLSEFILPKSHFEKLSFVKEYLGLHQKPTLLTYCSSGLRSLQADTRVLVEVITRYKWWYARIFVLVSLGVGCTAWYGFAPAGVGGVFSRDVSSMLAPIDCYDPFFMDNYIYKPDCFRKISFVQRYDVSSVVAVAFDKEHPFAEIIIPASGNMFKAVGLGVMIAFFIAAGIVPTEISDSLLTT